MVASSWLTVYGESTPFIKLMLTGRAR